MVNQPASGVPDDALGRSPLEPDDALRLSSNASYSPNAPTKAQNPKSKTITIKQPPEYEHKLLMALACFLNRPIETQANAALCMYLRQGQDRIMSQVRYYAHKAGMGEYELLDKIAEDPDWVQHHVVQGNPIHPTDEPDVFT